MMKQPKPLGKKILFDLRLEVFGLGFVVTVFPHHPDEFCLRYVPDLDNAARRGARRGAFLFHWRRSNLINMLND